MKAKKILLVSRIFYPVNSPRSFRTTELVKEFARQGHHVTLYTVRDDDYHEEFEREHGVVIKDLGRPPLSGFSTAGGRVKNLAARAVNRGLSLLFEYPDIQLTRMVQRALKNEHGYDLMISIAVPHTIHWGVAAARSREHPIADVWAADCGDPYMGEAMDSFRKLFYFKYVEKWFCRKADYITVPIEEAKEAYYSEFREKMRVIPQGFKFDEISLDGARYSPNPVPTFAYAGGLIPGGRDPGPFLDYLTGLDREFKCIFYTRSTAMVEPYAKRSGGRIEIRDYIPRSELLKVLNGMDFLVNVENKTGKQLPSKLIDYHLAGRPVLSVETGKVDRDKVDSFLEGDYSQQLQFDDVDQYRIENVCDRFLSLQNGIADSEVKY